MRHLEPRAIRQLPATIQGIFTVKSFTPTSAFALAAVLAVALLAGCVTPQDSSSPSLEPGSAAKALSSAPASESNVVGQARTFTTEVATYTLSDFESLPNWQRNELLQTWPAFLSSCQVLARRGEPWKNICERARRVNKKSTPDIRAFFERQFAVYQIRDANDLTDGVVTGYSEPEIAGSRKYRPPYIYPVYGEPQDILYLDTRKLPASGVVTAQITGRQVTVQSGLSTRDLDRTDLYVLDLAQVPRNNTLDRRARLRIEGKRLLPYYTRQEIETRGAPNVRVLAFVSSAAALYAMQIQGLGGIRLSDGTVIHLSYAEQNGQAFRPMLDSTDKVRANNGVIELDPGDDGGFFSLLKQPNDNDAAIWAGGLKLAPPAQSGPVAVPGRRSAGASGSDITDPSYVFFRETPARRGGLIGAMGVPLWPGYSVAVDPRSIPLGYPVFVSTRLRSGGLPVQRLLMAQDTSNAVRGALRADYFFGSGQEAARQARIMRRQRSQFWLLLPRGLALPGASRTRANAGSNGLPQCLVPDEQNCAND